MKRYLVLLTSLLHISHSLFPRESETRQEKLLTGIWDFRADNSSKRNAGFLNEWYKRRLKETGDVISMPVPASYNDVTQDAKLRDFVGWVWYDREYYVPLQWNDEEQLRIVLRFESCHYYCVVWVNGERVMDHEGGHLPFETEVSANLKYGASNFITVAANNTLTPKTLPPGSIQFMNDTRKYPDGYFVQNLQMDFFNYAGIHRNVKLYVTPTVYLLDLSIFTEFEESQGILKFRSSVAALQNDNEKEHSNDDIFMTYQVIDADGNVRGELSGNNIFKGSINVSDVHLWWPVDMHETPGYLYTLKVKVNSTRPNIVDIYRHPFGFRTVDVDKKNFYINKKPFYFKGFGLHEDSNIRGKGLDLPIVIKDFNLINWIGANSFRTSHYPYADEIMDLADQQGIVVIDECPGVGIEKDNMETENLEHHKDVMKELIHRDKNHPSVVMWSVANEPESQYNTADAYFKEIISYTKNLDSSRPVTFVGNQNYWNDKAVKYNDVICFNRYYAWYHDYGHLEIISRQLEYDLKTWHEVTNKPVIMAEYGADTVAGLHRSPPVMFSEEYQVDTVKQYFPIFDKLRGDFLIGEMIWNFADFATVQGTTRVDGNKKGIFTRDRQPKYVAHILRERYRSLSSLIPNVTMGTTRGIALTDITETPGYLINFLSP